MNMGRNFCVLFATKNHYSMFENYIYKYSIADFNEVMVINVDIDSTEEENAIGKNICEKFGIHNINSEKFISNQSSLFAADEYLTKNKIDLDWILFFQHDVVPIQENFWDKVDKFIVDHPFIKNQVGMFGANSYQNYNQALITSKDENIINRRKNNTKSARGNLVKGILNKPYKGWYTNLPDNYYKEEYFIVESPNWQCVAFNRKLLKKNILQDEIFRQDLWPDDIAHQFMLKGYYHLALTDLLVSHDHTLKEGINLKIDQGFLRNKNSHIRFKEKYGWHWGYRNKLLRFQFYLKLNSWFEDTSIYNDSIQKKLFNININNGPIASFKYII